VASFLALGVSPPWALLGVAYCGAQLVSFLPVTPGGLGLVEGSLTLTLAVGGAGEAHVLAAVLLYRLFSYWATAPAGGLAYLSLRRSAGVRAGGRTPMPAVAFVPASRAPMPAVAFVPDIRTPMPAVAFVPDVRGSLAVAAETTVAP
jgi:hypothetical protein